MTTKEQQLNNQYTEQHIRYWSARAAKARQKSYAASDDSTLDPQDLAYFSQYVKVLTKRCQSLANMKVNGTKQVRGIAGSVLDKAALGSFLNLRVTETRVYVLMDQDKFSIRSLVLPMLLNTACLKIGGRLLSFRLMNKKDQAKLDAERATAANYP